MTEAVEPKVIPVGTVYIVQQGDEFTSVQLGFNENVQNKVGAVTILDMLRNNMDRSGWTTETVMRVKDAQPDTQAEGSGGEDTQAPPSIDDASDEAESDS